MKEKKDSETRGRKRVEPEQKRSVHVAVMLTPAEDSAVKSAASNAGMNRAKFIRSRLPL